MTNKYNNTTKITQAPTHETNKNWDTATNQTAYTLMRDNDLESAVF